jgi:cystathionine gamma-synthase
MSEKVGTVFTQAVHAGEEKRKPFHSLTMPIVQASTYVFEDTAALVAHMERKMASKGLEREEYGRYGNPTQHAVESKLAALEGGEAALLFDSGMGAIASTLLTLLSKGSHVILTDDCYRRTREFCLAFLERFGVETTIVPIGDHRAVEAAIRDSTRLIFSETPTNPFLRVLDLPRVVEIARRHGLKVIADSTFATPCNLKPLQFGVDLVIHSGTKYLGGHNDLLAGVVVGPASLIAAIKETQGMMGGIIGPHSAYLLLRGLKTLAVRVAKQNENGLQVAQFLEDHPCIRKVYYPGLSSHPDHELACRLMTGFGGVVSFEVDGNLERTCAFIDALQIPYIGPSLGGVESIIEQPALMSHFTKDPEERLELGIKDELVRYALGIEDAQDLIADLRRALNGSRARTA